MRTHSQFEPGTVGVFYNGAKFWTSSDGVPTYLRDMEITHLFYAARMIFNHAMTPAFRVLGFGEELKFHQAIYDLPRAVNTASYDALVTELIRRDFAGLSPEHRRQYQDMKENRIFVREALGHPAPLVG